MTVTFTPTTWVTSVTAWTAAQGNRIEAGINDCANAINSITGGGGSVASSGTNALYARFYNLRDPAGDNQPNPGDLILSSTLAGVNLTNYSPSGVTGFYAIITGYILPVYNETYTFYVTTDDASKLYIDGYEVIGQAAWGSNGGVTYSGNYTCKANKWLALTLLHTNKAGSQRLYLEWQSTSRSRQAIPSTSMKWDQFAFENAVAKKAVYADNGVYIQSQLCWSRNDMSVQSSAPSSPNTGDIWIDTSISL